MPPHGTDLDLRVLGPLEVRVDGQLVDVGSPMVRTLLARLLVDVNRVVSLDRLIDDLWDGEPPASATATLQSYVSHLRRALEPGRPARAAPTVLVTRSPGYSLVLPADQIDAGRFAAMVEHGRALLEQGDPGAAVGCLDEAISQWRGEPYGGIELEAIVLAERRRLAELHATAVEDRLGALLELGRHRYVLGDLDSLVAEHPYRERAWELLILAQYRSGRQVEALRTYQQARAALVDHAGVDPGPRLVELERRVIQQDPTLDWQPRSGPATSGVASRLAADDELDEVPPGTARPPLVGRDTALRASRAVLDRVSTGAGGVLLVGGEAGIGKTRLVEELAVHASGLGFRVAWGRSSDDEGMPGWWPWTEALSQLASDLAGPQLLAEGPALRHVLPDLRTQPDGPAGDADPGAVRFAVQRDVVALLAQLCSRSPVLVVLDDLHWADSSSLRLLAALAPELRGLPLLVIATYRPAELLANPALTDTLAQLARHTDTDRIDLHGLDRDAVRSYLEAAGVSASPRLALEVHDRSGGNSFFVAELTRLLLSQQTGALPPDGGAAARVPHAVHDVTRQRLARLPDTTTDLLAVAAIAGRSSDLVLLAEVAGLEPDDALERLEPAVATGLLELDGERPGCFRFAHDLQREAIAEGLALATRLRLHRRIGQVLAAHEDGTGASAGQIAHHFAAAMALGTGEDVLRWAQVAAEHASSHGAADEAVDAWALAIEAHRAAHPADLAGRYDLEVHLAMARRSAWDLAGAQESIDRAIELAERLREPAKVLEAAAITSEIALWNWSPPGGIHRSLVHSMERALPLLSPDRTRTRIRALGALGVATRYASAGRARQLTDEAVDLADALGEPDELARALNNAYLARWWWPDRFELLALADRILDLDGLSPEVEAIALMHRMLVLTGAARVDELAAGMERARRLREVARWPDTAAQLDLNLSMWSAVQGEPSTARELLERAYRTRYQDSTMWAGPWVYHLGRSGIGDYEPDELDHSASTLANLAREEPVDLVRPTAILALLRAGRRDEARTLAGAGPRLVECWAWSFNVVQWAEISRELDLAAAEQILDLLAPMAGELAVAGSNLACFGPVHCQLARLAEHLGRPDAATHHHDLAADQANHLGLSFAELLPSA